jgi:HK97 family phage prohead protease
MDLSKRANLLGTREVRGLVDTFGADWAPMVSVRAENDESDELFWRFSGEASIVEHPYVVRDMWGEFEETIAPGAFDKTLSENPLVMLNFMHNPETTMVTSARAADHPDGGLTLTASPNLSVEARIPKSDPDAQRVMPKVARGDASSMSFAFRVMRQEWDEDYLNRRIIEVNLSRGDVAAIVTGLGANPAAHGSVRVGDPAFKMTLDTDAIREAFAPEEERDVPQSIREELALLERIRFYPNVL